MKKAVLVLGLTVAACVGDDSVTTDSGADVATQDSGGDTGSQGCSAAPSCKDPSTLSSCVDGGATTTPCALGCVSTGTAHCAAFQPNAPVTTADLGTSGVVDVSIAATGFIDTATGAIDNVRPANAVPTTSEVKSGVGFQVRNGVGVFVFQSFTIADGVTLKARGANALAIVGTQNVVIKGILDARGYDGTGALCPNGTAGPGGAAGGGQTASKGADGLGAGGGKGQGIYTTAGPGGGGFGGIGGNGGGYPSSGGASALLATPIVGGSGGGGSSGAYGGGGGGAVQIVSPTEIDIGGGANPGGINAGGCGGHGGSYGATGGGGGSGGAILLQSLVVTVLAQGALAANGGAGSTGNSAAQGSPGLMTTSYTGAPGGANGYGNAGAGGYATTYDGISGAAGTTNPGGAGGGSVGRIRVENQSGTLTLANGAFTTPTISTTAGAPATVGAITTK